MLKHCFLPVFMLLALVSVGQSRRSLPQAIQQGSLQEQFTSLGSLSRTYEEDSDFKLIRRSNLEILRRNVQDSIERYQKELIVFKEETSSVAGTITALRDSIAGLDTQMHEQVTGNISFLGIVMPAGMYQTFVWLIILTLSVVYAISYGTFRKAKVDTEEHKTTAEELQEELRVLRKKSMEKEQQLKRQLLDAEAKRG